MNTKGWIMLRVLINRFYGGLSPELRGKFPKKDLKAIKQYNVRSVDAARALSSSADCLERIHYSWISPHIEKMPEELQRVTIGALNPEQKIGVCRQLKKAAPKQQPSPPIRRYLLNQLYKQISPEERLPARYLPHSYLNPLGEYSKAQLVRLIGLLGLRDLIPAVKKLVRSHNQEAIFNCLSEEERSFFNFYLYKQKDRLPLPPISLQDWDGNCKTLNTRIHRRGLVRLGKALSGQDKTLVWYILHTLDTGRAAILEKNIEDQSIPEITEELLKQVVGLMNYLDKQQ